MKRHSGYVLGMGFMPYVLTQSGKEWELTVRCWGRSMVFYQELGGFLRKENMTRFVF